ncbi:hypothetical protein N7539_008462 [Penicillium diatomitis]|uniref:Uncharacterized protein n=1 Tax=Penicillium diatomitis TaxID=2819901 RepID=A0A9W9WU66_9EURO|nr:uncharacterized protein N7539_008456 [Penicillium diatomitis]XP_056787150.1 uncharacterized protein N7539_008462 [Penicillium diatomitis]KAJ5475390.1 hypothetical protein N7539_008456 [Penicillium diatomitis]KAJ5475396.1 hypothetical protein N7539_008462 [Penicillium diatomitis]
MGSVTPGVWVHVSTRFPPRGLVVAASEALGSWDPRQCRSLWTLGRWPADPSFGSILGEAALRHTPFAGVSRGSGPPSEGRMPQPVPARVGGGRNLCVRTGAEEPRGGNWMAARASPVRWGQSRRSDAFVRPNPLTKLRPSGG